MGCCGRCRFGIQVILILSQGSTAVALLLTVCGWPMSWVTGILALLLVMTLACIKLPRLLVLVAALMSLLAAIGQLILAVDPTAVSMLCKKHAAYAYYDKTGVKYIVLAKVDCNESTFRIVGAVSGLIWFASFALIASLLCCLKDPDDMTKGAWSTQPAAAKPIPQGASETPVQQKQQQQIPQSVPSYPQGPGGNTAMGVAMHPDKRIEHGYHNPQSPAVWMGQDVEQARGNIDIPWQPKPPPLVAPVMVPSKPPRVVQAEVVRVMNTEPREYVEASCEIEDNGSRFDTHYYKRESAGLHQPNEPEFTL